jgi:hypothetical protein
MFSAPVGVNFDLMFDEQRIIHFVKAATMKLFYHFLIFVFVSLILVACANLFANDGEGRIFDNQPSDLKQKQNDQFDDSVEAASPAPSPYALASINYQHLLKEKDNAENKCYYMDNFYLQNIQMLIGHFDRQ